jgi:hypothetical protein
MNEYKRTAFIPSRKGFTLLLETTKKKQIKHTFYTMDIHEEGYDP